MATTVTKTFTATSSRNVTGYVDFDSVSSKEIVVDGVTKYQVTYSISGSAAGFTLPVDISEIPNGAVIKSVKYSYNYGVSGIGSSYVNGGGRLVDYGNKSANATNVFEYLSSISAYSELNVQLLFTASGTQTRIEDSDPGGFSQQVSTRNHIITLEVTYEVPEGGTIKFGDNNAWQDCNVYFGVDGAWQKCEAYFGVDGAWQKTQ